MNNLIEIQSQIKELQKQADEIKAKEFNNAVQEILVKMQAYGIVLKDLQTVKVGGAKAKFKASASAKGDRKDGNKGATVVVAKYRSPNGEAWSGRGLTPRWLAALVAQGQTKEEFAIKS